MGAEWFRAWVGGGLLLSSIAAAGPAEPALVTFRATEGVAEVRVRGATAVKVDEASGPVIVVHVSGATAARRVDRLALDTSAFGTSLARVEVKPEPGGVALRLVVVRGAHVQGSNEAGGGVVVRVEGGAASHEP
jgi:hypothetical protein